MTALAVEPATVTDLLDVVELLVCVAVALRLGTRLRRRPGVAGAAALAVFVVVAAVVGVSLVTVQAGRVPHPVLQSAVVVAVLWVPFLLAVLARSVGGVSRGWFRACVVLLVLEEGATLALSPLDPAQPRTGRVAAYILLLVVAWTVHSLVAAVALWRAGAQRSAVVRKRMRSLAAGSAVLALTLVLSGLADPARATWPQVALGAVGLLSVLLLALAFLLPSSLRMVWRRADLAVLADAEHGLVAAVDRDQVLATILPALGTVFGGAGVAVLGTDGAPHAAEGLSPDALAELRPALADADPRAGTQPVGGLVLATPLASGWLVVQAGGLAPVFGDDEAVLLGRVATLVDLAGSRAELYERERASRLAAESAGEELETLLHSVSHDLRSPLISVLGYLDVLRQEHRDSLDDDARHYLDRMSVNALYMQSLIADLLELSRVGRTEPGSAPLELGPLVASVLDTAGLRAPAARLRTDGQLPAVRLAPVRARQLLTNLVDNALAHGGRDDVTVTVSCRPRPDGGAVLVVADDGQGVPPEYRERVLRVFERLESPTSSPGTGIGLAICTRIVQGLGGSLTLTGPADEGACGTRVLVDLPPAALLPESVPAPRTGPPPTPATTRQAATPPVVAVSLTSPVPPPTPPGVP